MLIESGYGVFCLDPMGWFFGEVGRILLISLGGTGLQMDISLHGGVRLLGLLTIYLQPSGPTTIERVG